jgi:predicted outer membrane repeat protein
MENFNREEYTVAGAASRTGGMGGSYIDFGIVSNCTFILNTSTAEGGALNTMADLINCKFNYNSSAVQGGALCTGFNNIENCSFAYNSIHGMSGGAVAVTNLNMINCIFTGNRATVVGGGAVGFLGSYEESDDITISKSSFISNTSFMGGAIFAGISSFYGRITITNSVFTQNKAGNGGAVNVCGAHGYDTFLDISNCIFTGNKSELGGVSFLNDATVVGLKNNTLIGNLASQGGAMYFHEGYGDGDITISNCIIRNNYSTDEDQIYFDYDPGTNPTSIDYCNIEGGSPVSGIGNIDKDPYFADSGHWDENETPSDPNDDFWVGGDYHLRSQAGRYDPATQTWIQDSMTSPCIDAGNPSASIGWEPYPNGAVVNMGAYGGTAEASKSYFGTTPCEEPIAGDINGDCRVDLIDFGWMAFHWLEDNN